jgi:hypothetical protein
MMAQQNSEEGRKEKIENQNYAKQEVEGKEKRG